MAGAPMDATVLAANLALVLQAADPVLALRFNRENIRVKVAQLLADILTRLPYTRRTSLWVDRCQEFISGERGER